jgi:phage terminase small subunit
MKTKAHRKEKPHLTPRRLRFCKEYMIDCNGTQAATRAGFSSHRADSTAAFLLGIVGVQKEIDRLRKKREARLEASADFVIRELMRIAKFDIKDALNENGGLKDMSQLPSDFTKCIASVEIYEEFEGRGNQREQVGWTKKIRAWDKVKALELLAQHFGIFKRPVELDPKREETQKKMSLLQSIKILSSKHGNATIIENRIGEDASATDGVDRRSTRSFQVL